MDPAREFYGQHIPQGKGPYAGEEVARRLELFCRLTNIIDQHPDTARIQVRLDPSRINRDDFQRSAFMYMVERVDNLMASRGSLALLIADHDRQLVNDNVRNLSSFRVMGTEFAYGHEMSRVVDTVHHTSSHHSRLLQLADIYVYAVSLVANRSATSPRTEAAAHVSALQNVAFHTKYKHLPPSEALIWFYERSHNSPVR